MAADVSIGAARVHLVVDADEYDASIGRALNSAKGFGSAAEAAFDQSSKGARRAATNLLDYVSGLGRASTEQQRFLTLLQRAAREGADPTILQAGLKAWNKYAEGIEAAAVAARELATAQTEAARMNAEFDRQRGAEFDEANKINLARNALDQYVATLGQAATIAPELQRAMDAGVDAGHIQQASAAIDAYTQKVRELAEAQTEANRMNAEFDRQRGAEFDEATKIDQARNAVDRYVASLGQVSKLTPELQRGLDAGVDPAHIQRAAEAVDAYTKKLREMADTEAEAARMNAEFDRQRGAEFDEATKIDQARNALDRYVASLGQANKLTPELQRAMDAGVDPTHVQRAAVAVEQYTENLRNASAVEAEAFRHNDAVDRQIQQLQNLQQTSGKTYYEILKLRNAQLGISKTADPMVDAIMAQNKAMGAGTLSAKQYEFAMRGVPAQITDITTSLIAGQPAYMVLLYQGGQLRDMFGGIKPAAEALGKTLTKLVNPYVLTAAALGAVALAAYQADQRLSQFAVSSIQSGGFAGTTRELRAMADAMANIDGMSLANADKAVQTLASGGLLAGKNLQMAAEASARWSSVTGTAVDDVTAKYEQIAQDPLKALVKLNEAEHFLTDAQYQRIQALTEQGDVQEAVTEAIRIYYNVQAQRSAEAETQITNLTALWRDLKNTISSASESVGDFAEGLATIGRNSSWADRIKLLVAVAANPGSIIPLATGAGKAAAAARDKQAKDAADAASRQAALTKLQTDADEALQRSWETSGTKAEKYALAVQKLNAQLKNASAAALAAKNITKNDDGTFGGAGYQRLLKALADQNKDKAARLPSGRDATQPIKDQMKAELAALATQTQQIQAQYQLREVSAAEYYSKLRSLAEAERDVTIRADDAQIAALAGKKDAERQITTLKANSAVANEKYTQRTLELNTQEAQSTRQRTFAYNEYVKTLDEANDAIQRQMNAMVDRVGMGDREYEQLQARNQVYLQQERELRDIQKLLDEYPNSADAAAEADRRRKSVMEHTTEALKRVDAGYDELTKRQADWTEGASAAWTNWIDQVHDVAGQAKDIFSNAFTGLTDSLSDAVMGNLDSVKSYLASMQKMILDFVIKQRLVALLGGGGSAGSIFDLFGGEGSFSSGALYAKGGVPGGAGLSAYRNQIVSQPTFFPFARGGVPNVGLMGEQRGRSEGILPLAKTSGGELGVKVVPSKETRRPVQVTQQFYLQGIADRTTREQAAKRAANETSRVLNMG